MRNSIGTIHRSAAPTSGVRRGRGAPRGNRNAFKHGLYCAKTQSFLKEIAACNRATRALMAIAKEQLDDDKEKRRHRFTIIHERD